MSNDQSGKSQDFSAERRSFERSLSSPESPRQTTGIELLPSKERESHSGSARSSAVAQPDENLSAVGAELSVGPSAGTMPKTQQLLEIEHILQQDLEELYGRLEPGVRTRFKTAGEQTAIKIESLLARAKTKSKEVFALIFSWLKIIPGVNKFFIRQEAKIKTDQIMRLKR